MRAASLCASLVTLFVSINCAAAQLDVRRLTINNGQPTIEGIRPIVTSSWDDKFQMGQTGGTEHFIVGADNSWLRLVLDPPWPKDWTGPATIAVRYLDNTGPVVMQVDSSDARLMVNGAWSWTPAAWRHGSGAWVVSRWTIAQAGFTHRELGADFSVTGLTNRGRDPLLVSEITVSRGGVVLTADVPGLALGDKSSAAVTAHLVGTDGQPVPDGTKVTFAATFGTCEPADTVTANGQATTRFMPEGRHGEAIVTASCEFSAGQMKLPLVEGTGGVAEIECPVEDFEAAKVGELVDVYRSRTGQATIALLPEAAHSGHVGAVVTYAADPGVTWFNAGVNRHFVFPGAVLGMAFWAKCSEPNLELRWSLMDANKEHWTFPALGQEAGQDGWRRYGSTTLDGYFPNLDAVLDYPIHFAPIFVTRSPWSKADKGVLYVDDVVAKLLVARSEAGKLQGQKP
ncbi:MAG: hypothetical protein ABFE07_25720 [Armatimonadia bacterium]